MDWSTLLANINVRRNIDLDSIMYDVIMPQDTIEEYKTFTIEDISSQWNLFEYPLHLNDYGWIQNGKRNKRVKTSNLWVIDDLDGYENYHFHISSNKINKHAHKHNIEDKPDKIRYFSVRCIKG